MRNMIAAFAAPRQGHTAIAAACDTDLRMKQEKDPKAVALGQRISAARAARGLTQDELAARVGSRGPQVSRWERGEVMPEIRYAAPLADALGTTTDALLRDEDVLPPELANLFADRSLLSPPLTDDELRWCSANVRNHGPRTELQWLQEIRARRRGITPEQQRRQDEATGAARAIGASKGVPRRRSRG